MLREFLGAFTKEALKASIDNQSRQAVFEARMEAQAICRNPHLSYWDKQCRLQALEKRLQFYLRQQEARKHLAGCAEQLIKHS